MKVVSYGQEGSYIISDAQFKAAAESWTNGRTVFVDSLGLVLPAPRYPAGTPEEHEGLQIGYAWSGPGIPCIPGWVAIRRPMIRNGVELRRGSLYVRSKRESKYYWQEINPLNPANFSGTPGVTSDDVKKLIDQLDLSLVDDILAAPETRGSVPLYELL